MFQYNNAWENNTSMSSIYLSLPNMSFSTHSPYLFIIFPRNILDIKLLLPQWFQMSIFNNVCNSIFAIPGTTLLPKYKNINNLASKNYIRKLIRHILKQQNKLLL